MRRASLFFLAVWFASAQLPTGSIHGVVKDAATGEPLSGFRIQFSQPGKNPSYTPNNDDGSYSIVNLTPGLLTVTARSPYRQSVTQKVQLNPGDDLPLDLAIPANATVAGRVLNQEKEPLAEAFVWMVQPAGDPTMGYTLAGPRATQTDGSYRFDYGLTAGRKYYLLVERPTPDELVSAEPKALDQRDVIETLTYYGNVTSFDAATPVVLSAGEHREGADIKIKKAPYYCVDGAVDVSGKPAAVQFSIDELALTGVRLLRLKDRSSADGRFRVCGLTPGQYLLSTDNLQGVAGTAEFTIADRDVHHVQLTVDLVSLRLELAWDGDPPPQLDLPANVRKEAESFFIKGPDGSEIALPPGSMEGILGTLDATRSVRVKLTGVTNSDVLTNGFHSPYSGDFGKLSAGDYILEVTPYQGCCTVKSMVFDGVPFSGRKIHIAAGTSSTLRVVLDTAAGTLDGVVKGEDGKPLSSFVIIVAPESEDREVARLNSFNDSYLGARNWNLPPGKYRVLAIDRPLSNEELDKVWQVFSNATTVEIKPKSATQVSLTAVSID